MLKDIIYNIYDAKELFNRILNVSKFDSEANLYDVKYLTRLLKLIKSKSPKFNSINLMLIKFLISTIL